MYQLCDIKTIHLEITNKCQASCPMCARNLQGGIDNPFMNLSEITIKQFTDWFSPTFIKQLDKLYMCGNLGDPIIAKDTIEIFAYCREYNDSMELSMNTNGSARSRRFWEQLAELNVNVRFGIDGLVDTHKLYRRGTDFDMIIKNASTFISHGGKAIWDMLIFKHNEHQVDDCKKLSEQLGFVQFVPKNTSRFKENKLDVIDRVGKKEYTLYPSIKSKTLTDKTIEIKSGPIQCKAKNGSLYVTSHGIITPCCWLGIDELPHHNPSRIDYLNKIEKFYSLTEHTLKEIFDSGIFDKISNTWDSDALLECSKQCGTFNKFESQYETT
jgi:MoaA/NifB/PqqE/SkfB family radical SAM enzyme